MVPSSNRLGNGPLKAEMRVRTSLESPCGLVAPTAKATHGVSIVGETGNWIFVCEGLSLRNSSSDLNEETQISTRNVHYMGV